jgi:hypothetical protein
MGLSLFVTEFCPQKLFALVLNHVSPSLNLEGETNR